MPVKSAEEYIASHPEWTNELFELREMILSTGLEETIKWGAPIFMWNGKNVVSIAAFKNHIGIWFYQGALLKENTALLENTQEGKTKALRQIKFQKGQELPLDVLRKYVLEAKQNQQEGNEIKPEKNKKIEIPEELSEGFKKDETLKSAFQELSPGRQREYAEYISSAKREETKINRLEKIVPMIRSGQGLHDKYRNC